MAFIDFGVTHLYNYIFSVSHGADVSLEDTCGMTPLHALATNSSLPGDCMTALLRSPSARPAQNNNKQRHTALHAALYARNVKMAIPLIEHGEHGHLDEEDAQRTTALILSLQNHMAGCFQLLVANGANLNHVRLVSLLAQFENSTYIY